MKALILAAGRGSRLDKMTEKQPKCLVTVHDKTLLQWQLDALKHTQIESIGIVTGYQRNKLNCKLTSFHNSDWQNTNMVSSLIVAEKWLAKDTCLISYSDIIYSAKIVEDLINTKGNIVISYDQNWENLWSLRFENPLDDAETFSQKEGRLLSIGAKTKDISDVQGQYMGLLKVSPQGWRSIKSVVDKLSHNDIKQLDMTTLLALLLTHEITINTVPNNYPWYEVDNIKDLQLYNAIPLKRFMS